VIAQPSESDTVKSPALGARPPKTL